MSEEEKTTKLGAGNDFISLCDIFSKKYSMLSDGMYTTDDGNFKIHKLKIIDKQGKAVLSPTRVSNSSGIVQIQNDLKFKESTIYFFLIWGFVKFKDMMKDDLDVDKETIVICKKNYNFFYSDFLQEMPQVLSRTNGSSHNKDRVQFLSTEGKKYIK